MPQTPSSNSTSDVDQTESELIAKRDFVPGLYFGGVLICADGEKPTEEELDRRFEQAEEAVWKQLHEEGALPLRSAEEYQRAAEMEALADEDTELDNK